MLLLTLGLVLWVAIHSLPLFVATRDRIIARLGAGSYKGLFSLGIIAALVCMVLGWRSAQADYLYSLGMGGRHGAMLLMFFAVLLFTVNKQSTRIKQWLPHPQLSGVALWSCAHLLANGDTRSLLLFSSIGLWALLEMFFISRRDGARQKPLTPPWWVELRVLIIAVLATALLAWLHRWLAGVPLLPF